MTTPTTGPFNPPTLYAPNPMPADIDWERVESTLGVKIVSGLTAGPITGPASMSGLDKPREDVSPQDNNPAILGLQDFDDRYRDARRDEDARVRRVRNLDPSAAAAVNGVIDAIEDGVEVFVVVDPVLVRAVKDLMGHGSSPSSVSGTTPSQTEGSR